MADGRVFVVVSGLPGSGKTTVAGLLATQLVLPLLDKDRDCDPDTAAQRFRARVRHAGHLDAAIGQEELARRTDQLRRHYLGPLRLGGPLLVLDTNGRIDPSALGRQVTALLDRDR